MKKALLWIKKVFTALLEKIKTLVKVLKIRIRKARAEFRKKERSEQTRFVYISLTAGTVIIAFLMVLLNRGIFALSEKRLFNREAGKSASASTEPAHWKVLKGRRCPRRCLRKTRLRCQRKSGPRR